MKAILRFSFSTLFCLVTLSFLNAQTQVGGDIDGETAGDQSGRSVSISSDGTKVAIGAWKNDGNGTDAGHVRVYEESGGIWTQLGNDIDGETAGDESGFSVSISSDGTRVAIGAPDNGANGPNSGQVRIFEENGGAWNQVGSDIDGETANDGCGASLSLSSDGTRVAIGAPANDGNGNNSGQVRIYEENGGTWNQVGDDIYGEATSDMSGHSVFLSSDGTRVAIGAPFNEGNGEASGHVRIYEENGGSWTQVGDDIDGEAAVDRSGWSVSLSSDGTRVAIGAIENDGNGTRSGHVRIYEENGGSWTQVGDDIDGEAATDFSGRSVSLSSDGTRVAIGAASNEGNGGAGHVRIYEESGGIWNQIGSDIDGEATSDGSGWSVSLSSDGTRVAIGAPFNDGNGTDAGHVRIYEALDGPLPIELKDFIAKQSNQFVHLSWQTASESNHTGFDLQHSVDGANWSKLDFIESKGDTEQLTEYQYQHIDPAKGINYYRLKMIDLDETFEYSEVIFIEFEQKGPIRIFPNPTSGFVEIQGIETGEVRIFNSLGKLIKSENINSPSIDLSQLPRGLYLISVRNNRSSFTERVIRE